MLYWMLKPVSEERILKKYIHLGSIYKKSIEFFLLNFSFNMSFDCRSINPSWRADGISSIMYSNGFWKILLKKYFCIFIQIWMLFKLYFQTSQTVLSIFKRKLNFHFLVIFWQQEKYLMLFNIFLGQKKVNLYQKAFTAGYMTHHFRITLQSNIEL